MSVQSKHVGHDGGGITWQLRLPHPYMFVPNGEHHVAGPHQMPIEFRTGGLLSTIMGKSGKGLKAALHSQQNRLKAKEKVNHALQVAEQKSRKKGQPSTVKNATAQSTPSSSSSLKLDTKGKKKASGPPRRPTIPFKSTDSILLIGEGNFSFARALIDDAPGDLTFLPPSNITATAYDTEQECHEKYPECQSIVISLRERGVQVLFGVDGTRLEKYAALKGRKWDRIVWNFPHAGEFKHKILSNMLRRAQGRVSPIRIGTSSRINCLSWAS